MSLEEQRRPLLEFVCYCRDEDEDGSPELRYACGHGVHAICLRRLLRFHWKEMDNFPKTVDDRGRIVMRPPLTCQWCRGPISKEILHEAQVLRRLLPLNFEVPEERDPRSRYEVHVRQGIDRQQLLPPLSQPFFARDCPRSPVRPGYMQILLDVELVTRFPSEEVRVQIFRETPSRLLVKNLLYEASELQCIERDAEEESEVQIKIEKERAEGRLRVLSSSDVEDEFEDEDSQPLPSIQELADRYRVDAAAAAAAAAEPSSSILASLLLRNTPSPLSSPPTPSPPSSPPSPAESSSSRAGPSSIDPDSAYWRRRTSPTRIPASSNGGRQRKRNSRLRKTREEKELEMKRREKNILKQIKKCIQRNENGVRQLTAKINRWERMRRESDNLSSRQVSPHVDRLAGILQTIKAIFDWID